MKKEMKKNLFMVAAVALMAMISCNKEEMNIGGEPQVPEVLQPSYYVEFTADLGAEETVTPTVQQSATRTTIDVANKKTLWVEGDAISVNGKKFVVKELIDGGRSATFVNAEELPANFDAPYTAKYPYKANGTIEIPTTQTAVQGGIDPAYVPAVAYSDDNSLSFKHAASIIKFQVAVACNQVVLSSDDALAGTLTVTLPEEFDGVPTFSAATKTVTVNGSFVTGQDYYLAVLPGKKNNFEVRIDGYLSKNAASVNIARSNVVNMKTLPEPLRKVYVKNDLNLSDLSLYAWDAQQNSLVGTWPGVKLSTTETINGNKYYVYDLKDVSASVTGIIVNGKATKSGSTKVLIQTSNITDNLKGNKYYRLSIRENYYKEVDPNDLSTFGFRIYVYIQKGDNHVDPYLHIWSTTGITDTNWNNQLKMTDSWVYPETGGKQFYYYEPPTTAYSSMNFIVTLNNGSKQTGDIKGALKNDYYVCAWADSKTSCGLYCNSTNNNSITATNIIKDNPEACK